MSEWRAGGREEEEVCGGACCLALMAKRGAEALACRVPPWENLLSHTPPKRSRGDPELDEPRHAPLWRGSGSKKRKRGAEEEEEEEAAALNGRRAEGKRGVGSAAVAQAGTPPPPPPRVGTVEATLSEGEGFVAEQRHRSPKTPDGDKVKGPRLLGRRSRRSQPVAGLKIEMRNEERERPPSLDRLFLCF